MAKQATFFSSEDHNYADATLTIDNIYALTETQTAFIEIDDYSYTPAIPEIPSAGGLRCLSFHNISYEVQQRKCCFRKPSKRILKSVSGVMLPGLNAIMGPTGSGKTTLLDILADRKDKSGLTGAVLIDGKRKQHNFKCSVGYVVQDDAAVVMGTLTVRENLHFSAALRLPSHTTWEERKLRVEKVIKELGLSGCSDSKIGNEFIRGVSGGERRRTSIGMELIIEPQILFLDEPTTGLDANTAVSVIKLLKDLSQVNDRIVILSIHQPRYAIFKQFDSLTLLSLGALVYHGLPQRALGYFEEQGLVCEQHDNPADFFLDIINANELNKEDEKGVKVSNGKPGSVDFNSLYLQSEEYRQLKAAIDPMLEGVQQKEKASGIAGHFKNRKQNSIKYATSFFWQLLIVSLRSAVNLIRNPLTSILQFFTVTFFALIIGVIYFQRTTEPLGFNDRIGVFFFVVVNQAFGSLSALEVFIQQKVLFIHENASGYYSVSAFFFAKVLTDIIPLRILPNIVFAIITYFMIGLQLAADKFFIYFLTIMLGNIAAVSISFSISAAVNVASVANLFISIVYVVSLLFGGLLVALQSLPGWIEWMKFLSFIRYSIEAMAINEMDGLVFSGPCAIDISLLSTVNTTADCSFNTSMCTFDGLEQLSLIGYQVDWLWYDQLALVLFSVVFLFIAYIILLSIKKDK